jgi:hypothetical protein
MNERNRLLADLILDLLRDRPEGAALQYASTEEACGGYGRMLVVPGGEHLEHQGGIEVRIFGWPRLTPGDEYEEVASVAAMLRLGFVYDGHDWTWRRPFMPTLVPVAAHAMSRAMAEAWQIVEGDPTELLVHIHLLDADEIRGMVDGSRCDRCTDQCGRVHAEEDQ